MFCDNNAPLPGLCGSSLNNKRYLAEFFCMCIWGKLVDIDTIH